MSSDINCIEQALYYNYALQFTCKLLGIHNIHGTYFSFFYVVHFVKEQISINIYNIPFAEKNTSLVKPLNVLVF